MVWGRSGPAVDNADTTAPPVSAVRAAVGLGLVAALVAGLAVVAGLGPTWPVVAAAAAGTGAVATMARASARVAVVAVVFVGLSGLVWIELVNEAQYGTMSLSAPPPLVRWCGATYTPDGMAATAPGTPGYSKILRTPSGHDVYGVEPRGHQSCTPGGALFVESGPGRYLVYGPSR